MDPGSKEFETMGFYGILKQAYKTLFSMKKIFTQITLVFIFPISLLMLSHLHILEFLFREVVSNRKALYNSLSDLATSRALLDFLNYQYVVILLVNVPYLLFIFILSLLSSSAVAYTVGCVYAGIDLRFKSVVHVVLTIWKKFLIKHTWMMLYHHLIVLNFLLLCLMCVWLFLWRVNDFISQLFLAIMFSVSNISAVLNFVWHLVGAVGLFEDLSSTQAADKIDELTTAKFVFVGSIVVMLHISLIATGVSYYKFVVLGSSLGYASKVVYGIFCSLLVSRIILIGLVVQTIAYFVWKAHIHEKIEKYSLSDNLQSYLAEHGPQKENWRRVFYQKFAKLFE